MNFIDRLMGRKAAQLTYDQIAGKIDGDMDDFAGLIDGQHVTNKTALHCKIVVTDHKQNS